MFWQMASKQEYYEIRTESSAVFASFGRYGESLKSSYWKAKFLLAKYPGFICSRMLCDSFSLPFFSWSFLSNICRVLFYSHDRLLKSCKSYFTYFISANLKVFIRCETCEFFCKIFCPQVSAQTKHLKEPFVDNLNSKFSSFRKTYLCMCMAKPALETMHI